MGSFVERDVGRVAYYQIEEKWRAGGRRPVKRRVGREGSEKVRLAEGDLAGEAQAGGVALGYGQGGGGDVGGVDLRGGEFPGQGDGDAAGACADVEDGETFAG